MAKIRGAFFKMNLRQLLFAALMGSLAFAVRNAGFYIIISYPFRFDPRWVFSLLAACWAGPGGGLIAGTLAAIKFDKLVQADLAAIPAHFFVGLFARWLIQRKVNSVYACFLWPLLGVPLYWLATLLFTPAMATIALVPVLAFIGISSSLLTLAVGLAVEKRASSLLSFLRI
jgi:hypothetical protein